ncbi:uncharacterized protein [Physcomitrium patens]|uniref:WRC domain-containing protein n=1 Tax=Physcomitrium patens TaxID=3218 RepID=A0A2K1K7C1_PHYPA|nr:uncharacterized protein LOC112285901 [Physcomitrium patens]PNR49673.1 hypothetical protein PHYPA_011569 [Physcomitrium patens]|eukprot:XP_024383033.1 uncharacterized protein LOC112285901 [Physcomitrella patens]
MEDDAGIASTVVVKTRSAYTWLDKLRFLKGLLPQDPNLDFSLESGSRDSHGVYKRPDVDVASLEETWKFLFNAKEQLSRKSRKLCFWPKSSDHIVKECDQFTGQSDDGKPSRPSSDGLRGWDECGRFAPGGAEDGGVRSVKGGAEEDRLRASGVSDEGLTSTLSPEHVTLQKFGDEQSRLNENGRVGGVAWLGAEPSACKDGGKSAAKRTERSGCDLALNIAAKTQKLHKFEETRVVTQEHRQQRSGLKRRQGSEENGTSSGKNEQHVTPAAEAGGNESKNQAVQVMELASDHPSKKPTDSLVYITYQVFLQAGRGGLTAREAASRIEEAGLGAVFQGLVKPRIKIGKIIRNNPYYFQAGEGRYILCEAIVGVTQATASPSPQCAAETIVQDKASTVKTDSKKEAAAMARREGTARYWAQMNASGRTRAPKSRHVKGGASRQKVPAVYWKSDESSVTLKGGDESVKWEEKCGKEESEAGLQANAKPRLKGMYKSAAVGGKPCKRSDGKNWQCPLMAPSNSNYCEHHQKRMTKDTGEA